MTLPTSRSKQGEVMMCVELAIKERKIALPAKRLYFYCRWLGVKVSYGYVCEVLREAVKSGHLVVVRDGSWKYYKLRIR